MQKKVLFFCPSFSTGGVEKVLINLANNFSDRYATSFLVCQHIGELDTVLKNDINVYSLDKRLMRSFLATLNFFKRNEFDVIICAPLFINILTVLVVKLLLRKKTRIIISHHTFYDLDVKGLFAVHRLYKPLIDFFYNKADVVVAVSNAVKKHLVNDVGLNNNRVEVIYNPVLNNDFELLKVEVIDNILFSRSREYKILICVGRLSQVKNQIALIKLMPEILKITKCKLLLIGDGEEKDNLKNVIEHEGLERDVIMIGSVANPIKYMYNSDVLILPSITETFSLVAVEAIAVGTPVLSTPTAGVTEIMRNCSGCYFSDISNSANFINTLKYILSDHENIVVDKKYAENFTTKKIAEKYEALFNCN